MDIKRTAEELGEKFSTREIEEMIREADQDCKLACPYLFTSVQCSRLCCPNCCGTTLNSSTAIHTIYDNVSSL